MTIPSDVKWPAIAAFVFVWLLFGALYTCFLRKSRATPDWETELIKFLSFWFAGFGIVYSTLLTSFNALEASNRADAQMEFARSENAFRYLERWDSGPIREARDATRTIRDLARSPEWQPNKIVTLIDPPTDGGVKPKDELVRQENLRRSVISMFNYFQEIELAIRNNRANAPILKQAFGATYRSIFERFRPWLLAHKSEDEDNFDDLSSLYKRWE